MRDYKDMADAVFRRRDEYVASTKRKQKIALNTCLSLCVLCLATFGAFGIWKLGVVKPDPTIIGTTPPGFTETTEDTKVSIGSNATSEGDFTEQTQLISGINNSEGTEGISKPADTPKPQGTIVVDPTEKATKPQVRPTIPQLPTLPIGPQRPTTPGVKPPVITTPTTPPTPVVTDPVEDSTDGKPSRPQEVPPTSGDPKPQPPTTNPPWTDGSEVTDATSAIDRYPDSSEGDVVQPTYAPTMPATPPEEEVPPTEPVVTAPCWTEGVEPTTAGCCTEPTEPDYPAIPDEPATESPVAMLSVYGKVIDENGKAVIGAKIGLYADDGRRLVARAFTDSKGNYSFTNIIYTEDMYVYQMSAPSGYEKDNHEAYIDIYNHYSDDYIFVNKNIPIN